MKTILKYLIPAALALAACTKEQNTVEPDPAPVVSEPESYFVEGLVTAKASNPETRSWYYTNDANGDDVLKFEWSERAKAQDGTARFEGYWTNDEGFWRHSHDDSMCLNNILNEQGSPTYVAEENGNTNIHVSLHSHAAEHNANKLLIFYTGNNINHTYVFDDVEPTPPEIDGKTISFEFDGISKENYYVAGQENYEVLYCAADIPSGALTPEDGEPSVPMSFNFKHLETVFRVRIKNDSDRPYTLGGVRLMAYSKNDGKDGKGKDDEEEIQYPFAYRLKLSYDGSHFWRTVLGSWQTVDVYPVKTLPLDPKEDPAGIGREAEYVTLQPEDVYTVYMTPMANPLCNLSDWYFTIEVTTTENVSVGGLVVDGDAIAQGTGLTSLEPGYVYTLGMKTYSPYVTCDGIRYLKDESYLAAQVLGLEEEHSSEITVPASIEVGGKTFLVTSVAEGAFAGETDLVSVEFDQNSTFGMAFLGRTFEGCTSLETVTLPSRVSSSSTNTYKMFSGCSSLTSVTLPTSGLTYMGAGMFEGCSQLASLHIPETVIRTLGKGIFKGCRALGGHITGGSDYAIVDEQGAVYTKDRYYYNGWEYQTYDLVWIPENLEGDYTIQTDSERTNRILTNATHHIELTSLTIPQEISDIQAFNFTEAPKLKKMYLDWMEPRGAPEWNGNTDGSGYLTDEDVLAWYFSGTSPEIVHAIILYVPQYSYNNQKYLNSRPWMTLGITDIRPRTY